MVIEMAPNSGPKTEIWRFYIDHPFRGDFQAYKSRNLLPNQEMNQFKMRESKNTILP